MTDIFLSLLSILVIGISIWCYTQKIKFRILGNIPGPKPYPIFGNLLNFNRNVKDSFDYFIELSKLYEPTAKFWLGPNQLHLLTTDPDLIEFILISTKCINKTHRYKFMKWFLGNGLATSEGTYWHEHRKLLNPAFHPEVLRSNNEVFNARVGALINVLSEEMYRGDIEIYPFLAKMTTEAICENSCGVCVAEEKSIEYSEFPEFVRDATNIFLSRVFSSWKWSEFLFQFHPDYRKSQILLDWANRFAETLIEKRRQKLHDCQVKQHTDEACLKKKKIFLDIMLSETINGKPLDDTEIIHELTTILVAGIETTAILVSFALYELSRNPEIQDRVVEEIRGIFGDNKNHQPSIQDYGNMAYTELVLKEVLRLYPSVPFNGRMLQEDLDYKGTVIPKDTNIHFFFYGMHRREDLYPNADKFNPERFITGQASKHPYSFLPFSAGPRMCIGRKYTMYQAKCALSRLLMNLEVLPCATKYEMKLHAAVTLIASPGVSIQLKKREFK